MINRLRTRYSLALRLAPEAQQRLRRSGSGDYAVRTRSGYYPRKD